MKTQKKFWIKTQDFSLKKKKNKSMMFELRLSRQSPKCNSMRYPLREGKKTRTIGEHLIHHSEANPILFSFLFFKFCKNIQIDYWIHIWAKQNWWSFDYMSVFIFRVCNLYDLEVGDLFQSLRVKTPYTRHPLFKYATEKNVREKISAFSVNLNVPIG